MSDTAVEYMDYVLRKKFGETAVIIFHTMHIRGAISLKDIDRAFMGRLSQRKISACVSSLLRHQILLFIPGDMNRYDIAVGGIERLSRVSIYCKLCSLFHGSTAEKILFAAFITGMAKSSEILRAVLLEEAKGTQEDYKKCGALVDCLESLVKNKVLQSLKPTSIKEPQTDGESTRRDLDSLSKTELLGSVQKFISAGGTVQKFRQNLPSAKYSDNWDIILSPNVNTLEALWRDHIISEAVADSIDETARDILSRILCIAVASNRRSHILSTASDPVSHAELLRSLKDVPPYLDSYIGLLLDDQLCFLEQQPGITAGMYICPYKKIVRTILIRHVEHIIQILFENAGVRIFRILVSESYLSHETLERRLLIPQMDFRKVLLRMVACGYISSTEFSKTNDFTADSVLCLYHVDLSAIARLVIEHSQHALLRIGVRSDVELKEKSRLIEQRYKVECLIRRHQEKVSELSSQAVTPDETEKAKDLEHHTESIQALKSSITPGELNLLSSLTARLSKLSAVQLEAHSAWFTADLYLRLYCE